MTEYMADKSLSDKKLTRIFVVTQTFPPHFGGMENVMFSLAQKLSIRGHEVVVIPNKFYNASSSFRVINLPPIKPIRNLLKKTILQVLLEPDDVVICDSWKSVRVVPHSFKGRIITLAHGQEYLKGKRRKKEVQIALNRSALVVASSNFTNNLVQNNYEIEPQKQAVIPPTYMIKAIDLPAKEIKENIIRLISVCRLDKRKGLMQALEALNALGDLKYQWRWDIIGVGPEATSLKQAVRDFKLDLKVDFHHGVSDSEKREKLAAADIFVMPSYQTDNKIEGFGISFLEAAQYGVPAISGKAGGVIDAVIDGETGWCVDPTNQSEIRTAFREAINFPNERRRRGIEAQIRFANFFEADIVFTEFLKVSRI